MIAMGLMLLGLLFGGPATVEAAAPLRTAAWCTANGQSCPSGRPYAEATLCARADVIFCEDFNYPTHFFFSGVPSGFDSYILNPAAANLTANGGGCGRTDSGFSFSSYGREHNLASGYVAKPQGSMPSGTQADHLFVVNWDKTDPDYGQGTINVNLYENDANTTYCNGNAISPNFYIRFQVFLTADPTHSSWVWPGGMPKSDTYSIPFYPCLDSKFFGWYPLLDTGSPTTATYDGSIFGNCTSYVSFANQGGGSPSGSRFPDGLNIRYGNAGTCNYPQFPMWVSSGSGGCQEYGQYRYDSLSLNASPGTTPVACTTSGNPLYCTSGTVHRMDIGTWYTMEIHYRLSNPSGAFNGVVEVWITKGNGTETRIYAADDLPTCQSGDGDCRGLGSFQMMLYHNQNGCSANCADVTPFRGQAAFDNVVIATQKIGPPAGTGDTTPPAAPTGVTIAQSQE